MMGIWLMDVSVTTLNMGGVLFNGFTTLDPAIGYHIGMAVAMMSFFMMGVFYYHLLSQSLDKRRSVKK